MSGYFNQIFGKFDDALNKSRSEEYKLSILLSQNGFSFALFHPESNFFSGLASFEYKGSKKVGEYCLATEKLAESNEYLTLKYSNVSILYESSKTTLVPFPLFSEKDIEHFSAFNFKKNSEEIVMFDKLTNAEAYNVFSIPKEIKQTLINLFPGCKIHSHSSVLIETILTYCKNLPVKKREFVNVRKTSIDIIITEGNKLLYQNSFSYMNKEDFIYYILLVPEQLKINPEEIDLSLTGAIEKDSELFEIVYKYIRNVKFEKLSDAFSYSYVIKEIPEHYYLNLININRCEL
jgi:hypothetical protein